MTVPSGSFNRNVATAVRHLLNKSKLSARALIRKADAARNQNRWVEAARLYAKAVDIDAQPGIWVQLGHARKESGDLQGAEGAYLRARALRPDDLDVALQLGHLYKLRNDPAAAVAHYEVAIAGGLRDVHALHFLAQSAAQDRDIRSNKAATAIYIDCSDLVAYFGGNRFPTGIQRVQIELFKASLSWTGNVPIEACSWSETAGFWASLDPVGFGELCDMAGEAGGAGIDQRWRQAVDAVKGRLNERKALRFPSGAVLVNLGASWWMPDYMAGVRLAKARFGIRYVPLIYDLIPLITPEHVATRLTSTFAAWASSVFMHADLVGAISERTRQDVERYAAQVKPLTWKPVVMPLDARFGQGSARGGEARVGEAGGGEAGRGEAGAAATGLDVFERRAVLDGFGLQSGGFVLTVATLEVRKNHQLLFEGWRRLIAAEGADRVPTLICVGKQGFGYDMLENYLDGHREVAEKVLLLSGISDEELDTLYAECLFTVYASFYEGWGLPVTESLCHGKVCLCADHSSLPEAGGRFATYYNIDSICDFVDQARQLILDPALRAEKEASIASGFRPRSWGDVLEGFVGQVLATLETSEKAPPLWAQVDFGTIYHTRQRPELRRLDRDTATAEMLRLGAGWFPLEDWGMWARERRARLSFKLPGNMGAAEDLLLYLNLCCSGVQSVKFTIRLGAARLAEGVLERGERRMVQARAPAAALKTNELGAYVLEVESGELAPLRSLNELDGRRVGVGLSSFMVCRLGDVAARLNVAERAVMLVQD